MTSLVCLTRTKKTVQEKLPFRATLLHGGRVGGRCALTGLTVELHANTFVVVGMCRTGHYGLTFDFFFRRRLSFVLFTNGRVLIDGMILVMMMMMMLVLYFFTLQLGMDQLDVERRTMADLNGR